MNGSCEALRGDLYPDVSCVNDFSVISYDDDVTLQRID